MTIFCYATTGNSEFDNDYLTGILKGGKVKTFKNLVYVSLLTFIFANQAMATTGIGKLFVEQYPESIDSQLNSCRTCHSPVITDFLNHYGLALREAKLKFEDIETVDSDEDGTSNLDEITAASLPGSHAQANEVYLFTNKKGTITFDHMAHSTSEIYTSAGKCTNCHSEGLFARNFDDNIQVKQLGHKHCRECHKTSGSENAPTKCNGCHVKEVE